MKMTNQHYAILKDAFRATLLNEVERLKVSPGQPQTLKELIDYHEQAYINDSLTPRRMHFDLFWWVKRRTPEVINELMHEFYKYANDEHLHTALKSVVKDLKQES